MSKLAGPTKLIIIMYAPVIIVVVGSSHSSFVSSRNSSNSSTIHSSSNRQEVLFHLVKSSLARVKCPSQCGLVYAGFRKSWT